jgi:hypothetical protein
MFHFGYAAGRKFMEDSLRSLCKRGARMVRLDAYGYVTKKLGTRCFFEVGSFDIPELSIVCSC